MLGITNCQSEALCFISEYIKLNSYPPTIREVAERFQITARAAQDRIVALKKKGYIKSDGRKGRTITVLKRASA
jgi:repressor LexA